jgi:ubiquinone/menaquinone biosynthesis C-methylase UbiE
MLQKLVNLYYKGAFPSSILINGIPFSRNGKKYVYQSTENINNKITNNIIYMKALTEEDLQKSLPSEVKLNARVFLRRFGPFFTPKNFTEKEVEKFFDLISSTYEQVILLPLNKRVIYCLVRSIIDKKINSANSFRILDFGIGSGISFEVIKNKFQSVPIILYGLEVSDRAINICKDKGIKVKKKNSSKIPYPSNYFDGVMLSFVTGYFAELSDFKNNFSEIIRVLKPRGVAAFNLHRTEWKSIKNYQYCLSRIGFSVNNPRTQKIKIRNDNYKIVILEAHKRSK